MKAGVRPARPADKGPLMDFIKDVWGGHDYIPRVWEEWLKDRGGRMFVVEVDGVPVGMNRVRFTEDGEAWFEGVRVHPGFRGQGLASMLGENSMKVARRRGSRTFRLTSGSRNKTAHRQIGRMGFKESSRVSTYSGPKGRRYSAVEGARRVGRGEEGDALHMIESTKEFRLGSGVFWHQFTAISLTREVVGGLVAEGAVWTLDGAVAVTREGREGVKKWRQVCFIGGEPKAAGRLVEHVFSLKVGSKPPWRFAYVPQKSPIITELRKRGFERDYALILFERRAAKG